MDNLCLFIVAVISVMLLLAYWWNKRRTEKFDYAFYQDQYLYSGSPSNQAVATGINYPQATKYTTDPLYRYDEVNPVMYDENYVDIINALDRLAPNGKQIFNIPNYPYQTTKDANVDKVEAVLLGLVKQINEEAAKKPADATTNSAGTYTIGQKFADGFKDTMIKLGLPPSLYGSASTTSTITSPVSLKEFSNITLRETQEECQYDVMFTLERPYTDTLMTVQCKFVISKKNPSVVLLESFYVIGYVVKRFLGKKYQDVNDFYAFDKLETDKVAASEDIISELNKHENERAKMMQTMVNNLDPISYELHQSFNPEDYQTYKDTRTIYDDLLGVFPYKQQAGTESVNL